MVTFGSRNVSDNPGYSETTSLFFTNAQTIALSGLIAKLLPIVQGYFRARDRNDSEIAKAWQYEFAYFLKQVDLQLTNLSEKDVFDAYQENFFSQLEQDAN